MPRKFQLRQIWFACLQLLGKFNPERSSFGNPESQTRSIFSWKAYRVLEELQGKLRFPAYLEGYCLSRSAVTKFRAEAICIEFMKQWNVGVYFSLRFQEIAGGLYSALLLLWFSLRILTRINRVYPT